MKKMVENPTEILVPHVTWQMLIKMQLLITRSVRLQPPHAMAVAQQHQLLALLIHTAVDSWQALHKQMIHV
jgi:hypothetical protein